MKQSVLITGVAGFMGYHTAKLLLAKGYQVIGIDHLSRNYNPDIKLERLKSLGVTLTGESDLRIQPIQHHDFTFYKADILDDQIWVILKSKYAADYVIHYANADFQSEEGLGAKEVTIANFKSFVQVVDFSKDSSVRKLIYVTPQAYPQRGSHHYEDLYFLIQASHSINEFWAFSTEEYYGFESVSLDVPLLFGNLMSPTHPLASPTKIENLDFTFQCCPVVGYTSNLLELLEDKIKPKDSTSFSIAEEFCLSLNEYQEMLENFSN